MIRKNDFCRIMDELQRLDYQRDEWIDDIERAFGSFDLNRIYDNSFFGLLVDALEVALEISGDEDKYGYTWLTWWIYDTNYGKDCGEVNCNGKKFFPKTASDLYDIIMIEKCHNR